MLWVFGVRHFAFSKNLVNLVDRPWSTTEYTLFVQYSRELHEQLSAWCSVDRMIRQIESAAAVQAIDRESPRANHEAQARQSFLASSQPLSSP